MLHSITLKSSRAPVVHVHRQRHGDGAFGVRRPFPVVLVDVQIIRDDAKLLAGHLENFVIVNRVNRWISATLGLHGKLLICAAHVASSNRKRRYSVRCSQRIPVVSAVPSGVLAGAKQYPLGTADTTWTYVRS